MISELLTQIESYVPAKCLDFVRRVLVFMFVGTLVAIPIILMRLPANYFNVRSPHPLDREPPSRPSRHRTHREECGRSYFLFAGLLMLFLPGQGVLTMLVGLSLVEFPGRHR